MENKRDKIIIVFLILVISGLLIGKVIAYQKPFDKIKMFCSEQEHEGNKFTLDCEVIYAH